MSTDRSAHTGPGAQEGAWQLNPKVDRELHIQTNPNKIPTNRIVVGFDYGYAVQKPTTLRPCTKKRTKITMDMYGPSFPAHQLSLTRIITSNHYCKRCQERLGKENG